eukprot:2261426-Amphidinium_carterae.1
MRDCNIAVVGLFKEGAEGRHKWTPAQKAAGKCDTPLEEWKTTSAVRRFLGSLHHRIPQRQL